MNEPSAGQGAERPTSSSSAGAARARIAQCHKVLPSQVTLLDPTSNRASPVPFGYFLSLVKKLCSIRPRQSATALAAHVRDNPYFAISGAAVARAAADARPITATEEAHLILSTWIAHLPAGLGPGPQACEPGTARAFFHLLLPAHDVARRFDLKEYRLAGELIRLFALEGTREEKALREWDGGATSSGTAAGSDRWKGKSKANFLPADTDAYFPSEKRTGCLGLELERVLAQTCSERAEDGNWDINGKSMVQMDHLLDELATFSKYTDAKVLDKAARLADQQKKERSESGRRQQKRTQSTILCDVYDQLDPFESAVVTQIILKDLRPMLARNLFRSSTSTSTTGARSRTKTAEATTEIISSYTAKSVSDLSLIPIMRIWHPWMPAVYGVRAEIGTAADVMEDAPRGRVWCVEGESESQARTEDGGAAEEVVKRRTTYFREADPEIDWEDQRLQVRVGDPIEIPKAIEGTSATMAANILGNAGKVSAETKYDGERMQIHLELFDRPAAAIPSELPPYRITIYSKSGRDSTVDRRETHPIILAALGIDPNATKKDATISGVGDRNTYDPDRTSYELLSQRFAQSNSQHLGGNSTGDATGASVSHPYETPRRSVVLEGEMVAWDETRGCVAEFHKIAQLKASTVHFLAASKRSKNAKQGPNTREEFVREQVEKWQKRMADFRRQMRDQIEDDVANGCVVDDIEAEIERRFEQQTAVAETQQTFISDLTTEGEFHFAIIFFDVLAVDGESIYRQPYSQRRQRLCSLIRPIPGFSSVVDTVEIDFGLGPDSGVPNARGDREQGIRDLHKAFSLCHAKRGEGLVLKRMDMPYVGGTAAHGLSDGYVYGSTPCAPASWIKLKSDYIKGLGDTLDLCVIGVSWNKERARQLQLPADCYVELFLGAVRQRPEASKPAVTCWFTSCYGLSRSELTWLNLAIERGDHGPISYSEFLEKPESLDYSLKIVDTPQKPRIVFQTPLLAEVYGGGFTKDSGCLMYHLRWPRIKHLYRPADRSWREGHELTQVMLLAKHSVRAITDESRWKHEYLARMATLTRVDRIEWISHAVHTNGIHITNEECVEPHVSGDYTLADDVQMARMRDRKTRFLAKTLQPSRSMPAGLNIADMIFSAIMGRASGAAASSSAGRSKLRVLIPTAKAVDRGVLQPLARSASTASALQPVLPEWPKEPQAESMMQAKAVRRTPTGKVQVDTAHIAKGSLSGLLFSERQAMDVKRGMRSKDSFSRLSSKEISTGAAATSIESANAADSGIRPPQAQEPNSSIAVTVGSSRADSTPGVAAGTAGDRVRSADSARALSSPVQPLDSTAAVRAAREPTRAGLIAANEQESAPRRRTRSTSTELYSEMDVTPPSGKRRRVEVGATGRADGALRTSPSPMQIDVPTATHTATPASTVTASSVASAATAPGSPLPPSKVVATSASAVPAAPPPPVSAAISKATPQTIGATGAEISTSTNKNVCASSSSSFPSTPCAHSPVLHECVTHLYIAHLAHMADSARTEVIEAYEGLYDPTKHAATMESVRDVVKASFGMSGKGDGKRQRRGIIFVDSTVGDGMTTQGDTILEIWDRMESWWARERATAFPLCGKQDGNAPNSGQVEGDTQRHRKRVKASAARKAAAKGMCRNVALHPTQCGVAHAALLNWSHLEQVAWHVRMCQFECGRTPQQKGDSVDQGQEQAEEQEMERARCTCCPHFAHVLSLAMTERPKM